MGTLVSAGPLWWLGVCPRPHSAVGVDGRTFTVTTPLPELRRLARNAAFLTAAGLGFALLGSTSRSPFSLWTRSGPGAARLRGRRVPAARGWAMLLVSLLFSFLFKLEMSGREAQLTLERSRGPGGCPGASQLRGAGEAGGDFPPSLRVASRAQRPRLCCSFPALEDGLQAPEGSALSLVWGEVASRVNWAGGGSRPGGVEVPGSSRGCGPKEKPPRAGEGSWGPGTPGAGARGFLWASQAPSWSWARFPSRTASPALCSLPFRCPKASRMPLGSFYFFRGIKEKWRSLGIRWVFLPGVTARNGGGELRVTNPTARFSLRLTARGAARNETRPCFPGERWPAGRWRCPEASGLPGCDRAAPSCRLTASPGAKPGGDCPGLGGFRFIKRLVACADLRKLVLLRGK